jgi:hypothetical protein
MEGESHSGEVLVYVCKYVCSCSVGGRGAARLAQVIITLPMLREPQAVFNVLEVGILCGNWLGVEWDVGWKALVGGRGGLMLSM